MTKRAYFRKLNLSNVYFFDSKLLDIEFLDIIWKDDKQRYIIGDEIVICERKYPPILPVKNKEELEGKESIVESLYLQLCSSYDKNRLFDISGKFYISAMEMKRYAKKNWFKKNIFSWVAWYRYISLYGQSSKRAFMGIICVVLLSSFIITFDGSIPSLSNHSLQGLNITSVLSLFEKFIIALKINLFSLIHPAEWTLKENVTLTAFIAAWERLIVILLGTFFLLALKRQFRRS